ncbi:hypothetical protein C4J81_13120 [Deltaproteobacteria bacterium Smac51]|nr:hypothetical protein C4J81_13120 [Deltaproteobacteria bacterium Smac51]
MKFSVLLNGCSESFERRAAELRGFIRDHVGHEFVADKTIVLCPDFKKRDYFEANSVTPKLALVSLGGYQPEKALAALKDVCRDEEIMLLPGDFFGAEISVRLGARLGGAGFTGVTQMRLEDGKPVCDKKVYAQKMTASFKIEQLPLCLSIAKGIAEEADRVNEPLRETVEIDKTSEAGGEHIVSCGLTPQPDEAGLEQSDFLMVGGKGLGGPEGVERLKRLAEKAGADWGVSRPVAMSGWAPMERMIGVSGIMAKPEMCLCFGASGAAALYAGIARGRKIIAVNRDGKAPIIHQSDAAAIDDCLAVLDELAKLA